MAKGFVIHVGHYSAQRAIIAHPDPVTGQPTGDQFEVFKSVGSHNLINRARVWARRVLPDGSLPKHGDTERPVEVNDPQYKGKLEFLKWGTPVTGAQAIEIRFLTMSQSLDAEYQRTVQKIEPKTEDDTDHIYLTNGENKFDEDAQPLLVQFLKVYPGNRDSESKNPEPKLRGYQYFVMTDENADRSYVKSKERALDAGLFIKEHSENERELKNLLEIFKGYGADFGDVNHLSTSTDVYKALLRMSDVAPDQMFLLIERFKSETTDLFDKARSYKALDLTKDGCIGMTIENKPILVFKDVEAKGEKMINWVLDNFMKEEVYIQIKQFKSLCDKLK